MGLAAGCGGDDDEGNDDAATRVGERFRDPDGHCVGASGRTRVIVYNTEMVTEDELDFLRSEAGQRFYAEAAAEAEYTLVESAEPREGLPSLDELEGPELELDALGPELERTLQLLNQVRFTT
jgi:ABC-type Fe3+ transport system substrate-binding protein